MDVPHEISLSSIAQPAPFKPGVALVLQESGDEQQESFDLHSL